MDDTFIGFACLGAECAFAIAFAQTPPPAVVVAIEPDVDAVDGFGAVGRRRQPVGDVKLAEADEGPPRLQLRSGDEGPRRQRPLVDQRRRDVVVHAFDAVEVGERARLDRHAVLGESARLILRAFRHVGTDVVGDVPVWPPCVRSHRSAFAVDHIAHSIERSDSYLRAIERCQNGTAPQWSVTRAIPSSRIAADSDTCAVSDGWAPMQASRFVQNSGPPFAPSVPAGPGGHLPLPPMLQAGTRPRVVPVGDAQSSWTTRAMTPFTVVYQLVMLIVVAVRGRWRGSSSTAARVRSKRVVVPIDVVPPPCAGLRAELAVLRAYFRAASEARPPAERLGMWVILLGDTQLLRQKVRRGHRWGAAHLRMAAGNDFVNLLQFLLVQIRVGRVRRSAVRYALWIARHFAARSTTRFLCTNYPDAVRATSSRSPCHV